MDPRDYAEVRREALARAAVELGAPEDEAAGLVARVLEQQERRIRRAEDPDPVVHAALAAEVRRRAPAPERGSAPSRPWAGRWPAVAAILVVLLAVGVAAVALRPERPPVDRLRDDQVPSLFGYDAGSARRLLTERGLEVTVTPYRACEVLGRAVGADPATGTRVEAGDAVTVFASIPASISCLTDYGDRARAWRFLDFAAGRGSAPVFAARVLVDVDGRTTWLDGGQASERSAWAATGVFPALEHAVDRVRLTDDQPVTYAVPSLRTIRFGDRQRPCGRSTAPLPPGSSATSFVLRAPDSTACLVRIDLVRSVPDPAAPIEAVLLQSGS